MARDGAAARRGCRTSRRRFIGSSVGLAGFLIVPRHVLGAGGGTPPSEKLNIACIGVGGMGQEDVNSLTQEQVVALCDVDQRRGAASFSKYPQAKRYSDFRIMLEEMDRSIDAVTVSTPDHTHAVAAMAAIRRGKHVYCQKPLAHSIYEVRELVRVAKEKR